MGLCDVFSAILVRGHWGPKFCVTGLTLISYHGGMGLDINGGASRASRVIRVEIYVQLHPAMGIVTWL